MPGSKYVLVTSATAVAAVKEGIIDGEVYKDGEVWADAEELDALALEILHDADGAACAGCGHGREEHGCGAWQGCGAEGCGCVSYAAHEDGEVVGP